MTSDPEPLHAIGNDHAQGAVVQPNADAPKTTAGNRFELKRGMIRITPQQRVIAMCEVLNDCGKPFEALPEAA